MAFCCCKKSKPVKQNEGRGSEIGSIEENDHVTSEPKKTETIPLLNGKEENDHVNSEDTKLELKGVVEIDEKRATGVAKLPGSIYILCRNPSSILVHRDESPFDLTSEVSLKDLKEPWDLASSTKSNCLYVTDRDSKSIYKVTSQSHDVTLWLEDVGLPNTLTVTDPDDHVLFVRYGSPSSLVIYGPDAEKDREITLPDEIDYPKHAVRSSDGNYFVSGKDKGSEMWGVFEVNVGGEILRHLIQSGDEFKHLTESYYLAVDSVNRLIVADRWKDRLLRYDEELSQSEELLPKGRNGLRWPYKLHYVTSDSQLLVLQHDGRVGKDEEGGGKDAAGEKITKAGGDATTKEEQPKKDAEKETGKETLEEKKGGKDEEEEKEKATTTDKKTEKEEVQTEKTEGDNNKKEEEEDKKEEDRGKEDKKVDAGHDVVYIYRYL